MVFPTHIVAVAGITENDKGEILLVNTYNNGWVFPGGQVENGESLIDAVVRETKEESGIDIKVIELIGVYSNTKKNKGHSGYKEVPTKVIIDFRCIYTGGNLSSSDETSESKWVKKCEVLNYIKREIFVDRYKAYLNESKSINYMAYETKPNYVIKSKRSI